MPHNASQIVGEQIGSTICDVLAHLQSETAFHTTTNKKGRSFVSKNYYSHRFVSFGLFRPILTTRAAVLKRKRSGSTTTTDLTRR